MYVNFNENPRGNYYAGDCVVRAINIVTGISWDEIYATLKCLKAIGTAKQLLPLKDFSQKSRWL